MYEFADTMVTGTSLPWQWPVAALLCWGIVLCLGLIYLHPEEPTRVRRPSRRP